MNTDVLSKGIRYIAVFFIFAFMAFSGGCRDCNKNAATGEGFAEGNTLSVRITSPSGDVTIPQGQSVDFQGSVSGGTGPYTYQWEFGGDLPNSNLEDPGPVTFGIPGTYTVKFTATDQVGATGSAHVVVTVKDTTPPTVVSTIPPDGAVGVAADTLVSVTFSKDMDSATLTNATYTVSAGGVPISGTVSTSGRIAVFTPSALLMQGITYTAKVTTGAKDLDGNALVSDYTWSFTTQVSIAAGGYHTLAIESDGTLWSWGSNTDGQLGVGDAGVTSRNIPVPVMSEDVDWAAVDAGENHSLALKTDGTLWAWGNNTYGQLGDGTWTNRYIPVPIASGVKWTMVSAGWYHTLAIKSDGTLWAWGSNSNGQLGTGNPSVEKRNIPVQVGTDNDWAYVAAGEYHNLAIKKNGTLWAWGDNSVGQLGNGDITMATRYAPVRVGSGNTWVMAAAGCIVADTRSHSLALKSDGTLWSWGWNYYGQLGDGTYTNRNVPVRVGTDNDWTSISAGGMHSLAIKRSGTLWSWGSNEYGQLGNGDNTYSNKNIPVPVSSGTPWAAVSAGIWHSVGLKVTGTIWTWGNNDSGQLGDGSFVETNTPLQINGE